LLLYDFYVIYSVFHVLSRVRCCLFSVITAYGSQTQRQKIFHAASVGSRVETLYFFMTSVCVDALSYICNRKHTVQVDMDVVHRLVAFLLYFLNLSV